MKGTKCLMVANKVYEHEEYWAIELADVVYAVQARDWAGLRDHVDSMERFDGWDKNPETRHKWTPPDAK